MKKILILLMSTLIISNLTWAHVDQDEVLDLDNDVITEEMVIEDNSLSSTCLKDYQKFRNQSAIKAGLAPFVGTAGFVGAAGLAFSWEYAGWFAFKTAVGPVLTTILGTTLNFVLPTTLVIGTLTYETIAISRFIKASKAYRLVRDLYLEKDVRPLKQLIRRVQKERPEMTKEFIVQKLIKADQTGILCDGSLKTKKNKTKLKNKVAMLKDLEKYILSDKMK